MFTLISKTTSWERTLADIDTYMSRNNFAHVVSLNPENLVEAFHNPNFMHVYTHAEIIIADGVGILWAARLLRLSCGERIAGVDLMRKLISIYRHKKIVFVGGRNGVAQKALENSMKVNNMDQSSWVAFGDRDKTDPDIISHVMAEKPDLVFVAFGSPYQELWIEENKEKLAGAVCVGVGQGFDVLSGKIARAPRFCRAMGFEWLYRLFTQPWRWKRQLRLFEFIYLMGRYRLTGK